MAECGCGLSALLIYKFNHVSLLSFCQPCLQYWPETGMQQFGPMTVELLSRSTDDDVITRLFRVNNITRVNEPDYEMLWNITCTPLA